MKGLSLEVRVGLLILAALVLLGVFVFLLGGFQIGRGYTIYVDFDNPGNVNPGAPVQIGGVEVGSVEAIEYRGNRLDPKTGRRSLIRMRLRLDDEVRETIHEDAMVYVTSQSLLGESVLAVDPGHPEAALLEDGAVLEGVDPPRLDRALALGYELLKNIVQLFRAHEDDLRDLLSGAARLMRSVNEVLDEHDDRIDRIIANIETATDEAGQLMSSARGTLEGPQVQRILGNLDRTLGAVSKDIEPLLADVRSVTQRANDTLGTIGPEEREHIRTTLADAAKLTSRANDAVDDAHEIVAHIREGRGTVGAIVMDQELYDDVQEMLRDLKHNPWKFFWRE